MRPRRWLTIVGLLALVAACESTVPQPALFGAEDVGIPPIQSPRARMPPGPIPAAFRLPTRTRPTGAGPFPAIIALHGCGGRGAGMLLWERRLNNWGYAVLIPDSLAARG